jgi:transposase-like protein
MRRKVKRIPDDLAYKITLEYLTTEISQSELKKKYGFGGSGNIYRWITKFGLSKPDEKQIELNRAMKEEQKRKTPQEQKLEAEIASLKRELEHERLKTRALNTLIDVAERELKISVRKKSGAKQ